MHEIFRKFLVNFMENIDQISSKIFNNFDLLWKFTENIVFLILRRYVRIYVDFSIKFLYIKNEWNSELTEVI